MPSKPAVNPRGPRKASRTSPAPAPARGSGSRTRRGGRSRANRGASGGVTKDAPQGAGAAKPRGRFEQQQVTVGDIIRVERRFVLDGEMTCVADHGVYHGVQAMGSIEHILIETKGEVRLIPLQSVSEIVLEEPTGPRRAAMDAAAPERAFDPSFA